MIKNTLDPIWKPFSLSMQKLCNGDKNRLLQFEVFDWNKNTAPELIGIFKVIFILLFLCIMYYFINYLVIYFISFY